MARDSKALRIVFDTVTDKAEKAFRKLDRTLGNVDNAADAAEKSLSEVGKGSEEAAKVAEGAMRRLGLKSEATAKEQRQSFLEAYEKIKRSGTATPEEIARAWSRTKSKIDRLNNEMARNAESRFSKMAKKTAAAMNNAGRGISGAGMSVSSRVSAPMALGLGASIRAAANLEERLNGVRAVLNPTAEDFEALGDLAKKFGRTTAFSATEAAEGIEVLAANGLSAQKIMDGALQASLDTASATGGSLQESADLVTDIAAQFNIAAKDLPEVANQLTGLRTASKYNLTSIAQAFAQAGSIAGESGVELEDFTAAIAATGYAFKSGSDAGTSFKTFLQRLAKPSKEAGALMEKIGFNAYDAAGQLVSMEEMANNLQKSLSGMTEQQKAGALTTMFGADAMRTGAALASQGAQGVREALDTISKGDAAKAAEIRLQGLNGELKKLASASEAFGIALAESGILSQIAEMIMSITEWISKLAEEDPEKLKLMSYFAALGAVLGPVLVGLGQIVIGLAFLTKGAVMVGESIGTMLGWLGKLGKPLKTVAGYFLRFGKFLLGFGNAGSKILLVLRTILLFAGSIAAGIAAIPVGIVVAVVAAIAAIAAAFYFWGDEIKGFFSGVFDWIIAKLMKKLEEFKAAVKAIKDLIPSTDDIGKAFKNSTLGNLLGYRSGGYTGDQGEGQVAGVVHGREYVLNASATRFWGRGALEALNNRIMPPSLAPAAVAAPSGSSGGSRRVSLDLGMFGQQFSVEADEQTAERFEREINRRRATRSARSPGFVK